MASTDRNFVLHPCGCFVEYATDRHGEFPLSVEGCATNDRLTQQVLAGQISDTDYLLNIKAHRASKEV